MEKKRNLLHIKRKKTKPKDPCLVCNHDLYYNSKFSKRIGLFNMRTPSHEIIGWACPYCDSEFDKKDNIVYIYGQDYMQGKT